MFAWLNGPGKAFREPLAGSTNYLSAYDKQGRLFRANQDDRPDRQDRNAELEEAEESIQVREREEGVPEEEVLRRAGQREKRRFEQQELEARGGLPKERASDFRPYPLNREFSSQSVLSEDLRGAIHNMVVEQQLDLKAVSAALGVDIRRVAAVVRLMTIEKQWITEGKRLAKPYNKAILAMLPQTPYQPHISEPRPHEPINDLPVHPWTRQQIFVPTSESRAFTRADAAKIFNDNLLPADERIAHPELLQVEKWRNEGYDQPTRLRMIREREEEKAKQKQEAERKKMELERRTQVVVPGKRWNFTFQDVSVELVGKNGRGRKGVGIRYGMPHEDRKKGQIKIPTKVE